jgi:RHS repeat-associated protein
VGRETERRVGDLALTQIWDPAGHLHSQSVTADDTVQHRTYSYRADGSLTGVDDLLSGRCTFDLDTAGRVTAVHAHGWTERYAYDEAGNQTEAHWPTTHAAPEATGPRTYAGTAITSAGRVRYEHDAAGRTTLRQKTRLSKKPDSWRYTWDAEDRLTQVVTPDGAVWRYAYDPLGRRTAKNHVVDGTSVEQTLFTWDGPTLVEQTTTALSLPHPVTLTWDHEGSTPLAQTERLTDETTREEVDSRFYAIVTDLIGTPTELVDESGGIAWRTRSTLWGTTTWHTGSTTYTPLRFPGQYYDPETGLHYNYFRHYDPETARYTVPDPLGLGPAPNPVAYVDNPHTWKDPLGLAPEYPDRPGFVERMKDKFRPQGYRPDQIMRAQREPMRLGDLEGIHTPDLGDPLKMGLTRSMDDETLLRAINDPDGVGHVVTIGDGEVIQGNHRIAEALSRMNDSNHPGITPETIVKILGRGGSS